MKNIENIRWADGNGILHRNTKCKERLREVYPNERLSLIVEMRLRTPRAIYENVGKLINEKGPGSGGVCRRPGCGDI